MFPCLDTKTEEKTISHGVLHMVWKYLKICTGTSPQSTWRNKYMQRGNNHLPTRHFWAVNSLQSLPNNCFNYIAVNTWRMNSYLFLQLASDITFLAAPRWALHRLVTHSSFSSPACCNGVNTPQPFKTKKSSSRNAWVFFKNKELPRKQIFWKVGWLFSPEFNPLFGDSGNLVCLFLAHYQTAKDCISQGLLGLVKHPTLTAN